MTSLQNGSEQLHSERAWSNGKSTNLELQIHFSGREHRHQRENSHSRLKPNDGSVSSGSATSETHHTLPTELGKTFLCFLLMMFVFACNLFFTGAIHDRTPEGIESDHGRHPPLRDVALDLSTLWNVNKYTLLTISEIVLAVTTAFVVLALCFHEYRSIVFRRFFFLLTLLFAVRLISMNVTMLPISSSNQSLYRCEVKSHNSSIGLLSSRLFDLVSTLGWANVRYCGNYVYSGHTVMFVLNCLLLDEYWPSWIINLPLKVLSVGGLVLILLSEFDYTISIITAYYITTRLFWVYHTLANNASLKNLSEHSVNQICKEWWYPVFQFLEGNIKSVVPSMRYSCR